MLLLLLPLLYCRALFWIYQCRTHLKQYIYIYNFTEVQVSRVIIVLLLQNCFVWCKHHTHQAILIYIYIIQCGQGSICDLPFGVEVLSGRRRRASSAGPGTCSPGNVLKWICAETQSGTFWDTISRNVTVCALISSRLDDFSDIVTYVITVMITILFLGGEGEVGHFLGGSFYPSNTLDRTLVEYK